MKLATGAVLLLLALPAVCASSFRMLIDLPTTPVPGSALYRRSMQSYDVDTYFALRGGIAVEAANVLFSDPVLDEADRPAAPPRGGTDTPQLDPRPDELIVLGYNVDGDWVFVDYITDPWLVRGEFLSDPGDASNTPQPSRHYQEDASLLLTLPVGRDLHTVELVRPVLRNGALAITPMMRTLVPRD